MPRTISPRCLNLTADLYRFDATRSGALDADRGLVSANAYPSDPTVSDVPCAFHGDYRERLENEQGRIGQMVTGLMLFASDPGCDLNEKIVVKDASGSTIATVFADGSGQDMASRGMCWGLKTRNIL